MFELEAPSRLQKINDPLFDEKGLSVWLKREDEIHSEISGNKWRKLKYNFLEARRLGFSRVLTFGGAYSNHIAATAAAANLYDFQSIGVIRGEELGPSSNSTLKKASEEGMDLRFVTRQEYKRRDDPTWLEELSEQYGAFIIPEGGSNSLALKGVAELVNEIEFDFDVICCAVGTGGTLAGLTSALKKERAIGFAALKGEDYLHDEVNKLIPKHSNWEINSDYHFGGYAKFDSSLIDFIKKFDADHGIPLDPIYTGKMMYGIFDMAKKGCFNYGAQVIAIHTGGLQGIKGFNEKHKTDLYIK